MEQMATFLLETLYPKPSILLNLLFKNPLLVVLPLAQNLLTRARLRLDFHFYQGVVTP